MTKRPVQRAGPPRANRLQPRCTEQPRPQPTDRRPSPAKWSPRVGRRTTRRRRRGGGARPVQRAGPSNANRLQTSASTLRTAPAASKVTGSRCASSHSEHLAVAEASRLSDRDIFAQTVPVYPQADLEHAIIDKAQEPLRSNCDFGDEWRQLLRPVLRPGLVRLPCCNQGALQWDSPAKPMGAQDPIPLPRVYLFAGEAQIEVDRGQGHGKRERRAGRGSGPTPVDAAMVRPGVGSRLEPRAQGVMPCSQWDSESWGFAHVGW